MLDHDLYELPGNDDMGPTVGGDNLFQIIISDVNDPEESIHNSTKQNRDAFKSKYPDFAYNLLGKSDADDFISAHFSDDVLAAYRKLTPYAFKADLCRYCLLLQYGGLYADVSLLPIRRLELPPGKKIYCFRDAYSEFMSPWALSNGLIMAVPGRDEFRQAIDLVVENCREQRYGAYVLDPTGPSLFGRALAMTNSGQDLFVGDFRCLTGLNNNGAFGFVDTEGTIVAIRNKSVGADISHIGVLGTNNYGSLYGSRVVYGEDVICESDDPRLGTFEGLKSDAGVLLEQWMEGIVIFGPCVSLASGDYEVEYRFSENFEMEKIYIDVYPDFKLQTIHEFTELSQCKTAVLRFRLDTFVQRLETRLHTSGAQGHCRGFTIRRLPSTSSR